MRHIRVLENRLDKVMIKYNEARGVGVELGRRGVEDVSWLSVEEFSIGM